MSSSFPARTCARAHAQMARKSGLESEPDWAKERKGRDGMDGGREGQAQELKRQEGVGAAANALIILSRDILDLGDRILALQRRWAERGALVTVPRFEKNGETDTIPS